MRFVLHCFRPLINKYLIMFVMKSALPLFTVLLLAACTPSEPQTPPASAAQPASQPQSVATDASAASQASAAVASDHAASAAGNLGGDLKNLKEARWQDLQCEEGQTVAVRYFKGETGPSAQIRFNGATYTAPYSPELSNEDLNAFSNGDYTWTIGNVAETDFYRETDGFLLKHEQIEGMGDEGIVDDVLVQGCAPKA